MALLDGSAFGRFLGSTVAWASLRVSGAASRLAGWDSSGNPTTYSAASIAALDALGTGLITKTAANTYAVRTLGEGTGISITNADGVSGAPSIAVSAELAQIASIGYSTGDMLYFGAASEFARLAKGTDGQILTLAGGYPTWAANLVVGVDVQAYDADLDTLSTNGLGTAGLAVLADETAADVRATIGTVIGTDVQAYDSDLASIAALTPSTGDVLYYNSGWQRLAAGSDGEVLTLASGVPSWAAASGGGSEARPITSGYIYMGHSTTTPTGVGLLAAHTVLDASSTNDYIGGTGVRGFRQQTSTVSGNRAYFLLSTGFQYYRGNPRLRFWMQAKTASDASIKAGFANESTAAAAFTSTNAQARIEYLSASDTNWHWVHCDDVSGAPTRVDTGIAYGTTDAMLIEIKVLGGGTSVVFTAYDEDGTTVLDTHTATTNIPPGDTLATRIHGVVQTDTTAAAQVVWGDVTLDMMGNG